MRSTIAIATALMLGPSVLAQEPIELAGVPNLHRVSENFYRSGQPTAEGMRAHREMGIETIVNLRSFHSDRNEIGTTVLGHEPLTMKAWHPERKEAVRLLQIVGDPRNSPVLVHCWHGTDRTGALCALYRIAIEGWVPDEAVREMTGGGYGFHRVFGNLPGWVEGLDVEAIRKEAGIEGDSDR